MALKGKYLDRALAAKDSRYRKIAEKMGYDRRDMRAGEPDDIETARREYQKLVGRKPFMGWNTETIRQRMTGHPAPPLPTSHDGA